MYKEQEEPRGIKELRDISVSLNPDNEYGRKLRDFIIKMLKVYPKRSQCIPNRIRKYLEKHEEAIEPQFIHLYKPLPSE